MVTISAAATDTSVGIDAVGVRTASTVVCQTFVDIYIGQTRCDG